MKRRGGKVVVRLAFVLAAVAATLGTAGSAVGAVLELDRVPEELRADPAVPEPHRDTAPVTLRTGLSPQRDPNYGTPIPSRALTAELNFDARSTGADVQLEIDELEPNEREQEERDELADCMKGALLGILFDAIWDVANDRSFNILAELGVTAHRAASCIADHFGVGYLTAESIGDWMLESVVGHGVDVLTRDPSMRAFINWTAVTGWYSIAPVGPA